MTGASILSPHPLWAATRAREADPEWRKQYAAYKARQAAQMRIELQQRRNRKLGPPGCAPSRRNGVTKVGRDKSPLPDFKSGE
jgi:hypothetical protein